MKKIVFAATTSGTGKTTISSGVMRAFTRRGFKVAPFKVGPDYIDTRYHERATGLVSRNLDEFLLPEEEIAYLFARNTQSADIAIIEGVMGLYDGLGASQFCSTASMAKQLGAPVVLVIDAKAMAASAAALVLGFKNLDPEVNIVGVIANRVSTDSHFQILKKAIEEGAGIPLIGRIPTDARFQLSSRHLGLQTSMEQDDLDEKLDYIADVIEEYIDLDQLLVLADSTEIPFDMKKRDAVRNITNVRLGIAYDKAFHFYYQDALELLEDMGVELVYFSPMNDTLPFDLDGIWIGGGYPELYAPELSANRKMREAINAAARDQMPIFAECGGLMYLGTALGDLDGRMHPMVGVLPGTSKMKGRLQRFGYCEGVAQGAIPIAEKDHVIRGHEFHYSDFETDAEPMLVMRKNQADGSVKRWSGGYQVYQSFGSYLHTHFAGDYQHAQAFIRKMERYRMTRQSR